jgi:hypothetical protein
MVWRLERERETEDFDREKSPPRLSRGEPWRELGRDRDREYDRESLRGIARYFGDGDVRDRVTEGAGTRFT